MRAVSAVPVVIASWLDGPLVERIRRAEPDRAEVIYEPEILPPAQFAGDHHGPHRDLSAEQLLRWRAHVRRAEVMFDFDWESGIELPARAPNLRWVQATSSGIGPLVERLGLAGSPIRVSNAAGIHAQPLAEFVMLAALYFTKEVPRLQRWQSQHHWEKYCAQELAGMRMVIVGLGMVGRRVAELASAFGIDVIGVRRSTAQPIPHGVVRVVESASMDAELSGADFLVLIAPATPETTLLIGRRRLGLLPEQAVLINIGRGSLVDEPALIEALQAERLRGAALDVFAEEPLPKSSPLWDLPNVILAPHSISTVAGENDRLVELFIENLRRYLDGRPLLNEFDHARGY